MPTEKPSGRWSRSSHAIAVAIEELDRSRRRTVAEPRAHVRNVTPLDEPPARRLVARHVLVRGRLWERNKGRILVVDQVEPLDQEP